MSTQSLTDRYLAAATRELPDSHREEFRRELAERIGDDIDARVSSGTSESTAEYLALSDLGDPDLLAATYLDHPRYLIGPVLYPVWKRLMRVLALTVLPTVGLAFVLAQFLAHRPVGEILGSTWVVLLNVAVHLGFWTTILFAVIDRSLGGKPLTRWTPELLPAIGKPLTTSVRADVFPNLVFVLLLALGVVIHPLLLPFKDAGGIVPLFNPGTWAWLQWYLLGALGLELAFWIMLYRHGRWTYGLAAARILPAMALAAPLVWTLATNRLFNDDFLERTGWQNWRELLGAGGTVSTVLAFLIAAAALAIPLDGFVKARRAGRQDASSTAR